MRSIIERQIDNPPPPNFVLNNESKTRSIFRLDSWPGIAV
jgi:hypothetical protein